MKQSALFFEFSLWHDVFAETWIKAMLSPKTPMRAVREPCYSLPLLWSWILFWEGLRVIIPRGQAPALGCDPSLQTEASIPIIKSDLPGRHVEWISLCTAEASITVIPLQSASTLRGRWKKKKQKRGSPIHRMCHRRGHEEGSWRNQWPEPTTSTPAQEKNKRLSPPAVQSDNKPSTSKM